MNNIKVTHKILLLVVIAFLGMAVIGFRGWSGLSKAGIDMDTMYAEKLQAIRLIGDEIEAMRVIQVRTYQAIADPVRAAEVKKGAVKKVADYEKHWAEYEKIAAKVPDLAEQTAKAKASWQKFRASFESTMAIAETGNSAGGLAEYNRTMKQATVELRDGLAKLLKTAEADAEAINAQNEDDNRAAIVSMTVITAVAIVLLVLLSVMLIKGITAPLDEMVAICGALKEGDFRMTGARSDRGDEFGTLERALYDMRESIDKFMKNIANSTTQIAAAAEELTANSAQTSKAAHQVAVNVTDATERVVTQQDAVDNGNAKIEAISNSVNDMRIQAETVAQNSYSAAQEAASGNGEVAASVSQIKNVEHTVQSTAELVDKLGERSKEIGTIVDTISGIAGQTNLLALNAAIEAARAGEAGRGFAVVAEEVRKLAEQSGDAAQNISTLIAGIQTDTDSAVRAMKDGREKVTAGAKAVEDLRGTFDKITQDVMRITTEITNIAESVKGVSESSQSIAEGIAEVDQQGQQVSEEMRSVSTATEEQSASAQEIASASDSLAHLAQELQETLAQFKF